MRGYVVGVDPAGGPDSTVIATPNADGTYTIHDELEDEGQISAEQVAASHLVTALRTKLHRPEDNYQSPTEAALALRSTAAPRPTPRQARTVEAFNREPAFAEPCQIPSSDIEPVSRRKSRRGAYQREGKRARSIGRAVLRQIEADKRKVEKAAREMYRLGEAQPAPPVVDMTKEEWDAPRINPADHEPGNAEGV